LCQHAAPVTSARVVPRCVKRAPVAGRARNIPSRPRALGFDLGETAEDKLRPEAEAQALVEDAASLLFAQEALRGPAAQAYLSLLQQISVKASPTRLFTAYGAFFRAQQATGAQSFADHVVDEVIAGKGNPLAETCARGGKPPSALQIAATRADLELLQRLCVSETTVLRWCERLAQSATPRRKQPASWIAAAESLGAVAAGERAAAVEDAEPEETAEDSWEMAMKKSTLGAPARPTTRAKLRERVANAWTWGDALPALMKHWASVGVDEIGARSVLEWTGTKTGLRGVEIGAENTSEAYLGRYGGDQDEDTIKSIVGSGKAWTFTEADFTGESEKSRPGASGARAAVVAELKKESPNHVLVHGPPGIGKRFAVRSAIAEGFENGTRCVRMRRGDLRSLPEILAEIKKHPRARFVIFLEMPLCLAPYAEFHNELTSALDGGGGGSWPENAVLCATALKPSGLKPGAEDDGAEGESLAGRFGKVIAMETR